MIGYKKIKNLLKVKGKEIRRKEHLIK